MKNFKSTLVIFLTLSIFLIRCGSERNFYVLDGGPLNCPFENLPIKIILASPNDEWLLNSWNELMGMTVFEKGEVGDDLSVPVYILSELPEKYEDDDLGGTNYTCDQDTGYKTQAKIRILDSLSPDLYAAVFAHELGHVLGMKHTNYGVMITEFQDWYDLNILIFQMTDYFDELYPDYIE